MMNVKINKKMKQVTVKFNPKNDLYIIFEFNYEECECLKRSHTIVNIIGDFVYVNVQIITTETLDEVMKKVLHLHSSEEIVDQYAHCLWAK